MLKTLSALLLALLLPLTAAGQDAIDLSAATLNGGADVRSWPVTTTITMVSTSQQGIEAMFSKRQGAEWPNVVPTGWDGPVYYTLWLGTRLSDGVHMAASLNVYRGQGGSGAGDVTNIGQYSLNLWYLDSALKAHTVSEGETLYAMVTAGGLRGASALSVQERSNVVAFQASSAPRTFMFNAPPPVSTPPVIVVAPPMPPAPPVVGLPPVQPPTDLSAVLNAEAVNLAVLHELQAEVAATRKDIAEFREAVRSKWVAVINHPVFKYGLAAISGWALTHKWGGQ